MARGAIDHLVSLLILLAALSVSFGLYSQMIGAAVIYQRNHQVAVKATDLLDNMLLSTGIPQNWGQSSTSPLAFGLQQPGIGGFRVSPFVPLRLISPENTVTFNGSVFNNVSIVQGTSLYLPADEYVMYSTVSTLLGVNGSCGFQLTVTPTLRVSVSQVESNPLKFRVEIDGPGLPLAGASVNGSLYYATDGLPTPLINLLMRFNETDPTGLTFLKFPIDAPEAYSVLVQVQLIGLAGIGFYSKSGDSEDLLVPLIVNYGERKVALVHRGDVGGTPPFGALFCDCTMLFLLPTQNYGFHSVSIDNSTGKVEKGTPLFVSIPTFDPGILLIAYRKGDVLRTVIMPWGISALGISVTFGGNPASVEWVATDLREVTIGRVSYEVKLAVWSLTG